MLPSNSLGSFFVKLSFSHIHKPFFKSTFKIYPQSDQSLKLYQPGLSAYSSPWITAAASLWVCLLLPCLATSPSPAPQVNFYIKARVIVWKRKSHPVTLLLRGFPSHSASYKGSPGPTPAGQLLPFWHYLPPLSLLFPSLQPYWPSGFALKTLCLAPLQDMCTCCFLFLGMLCF